MSGGRRVEKAALANTINLWPIEFNFILKLRIDRGLTIRPAGMDFSESPHYYVT
jgi:hypothetical protein